MFICIYLYHLAKAGINPSNIAETIIRRISISFERVGTYVYIYGENPTNQSGRNN